MEEWKELPLIAPRHLLQARRIKHILTGDLEANIITNPYFFGKEKHFVDFYHQFFIKFTLVESSNCENKFFYNNNTNWSFQEAR